MTKINVALIGAGRIGTMHAENIIRYFPDVNLKIAVDHSIDKAWAQNAGIAIATTDVACAFEDPEIKAVIIATSSSAHVELIQMAATHQKAIFCEKPVALTTEDIQKAIDAVTQANVLLQVGFNRRFDPDFIAAKQAITDGSIGTPQIINIINRDPKRADHKFVKRSGGLFLDFAIHDLDMLRFLLDCDIQDIHATGSALIDPELVQFNDIDTALIQLRMSNGTLCSIECSRETHYGYDQRLEVFGDKGSIRVDNNKTNHLHIISTEGETSAPPLYSFVERYQQAYINQFAAFFDAVKNQQTIPDVGASDALNAMIAAHACRQQVLGN